MPTVKQERLYPLSTSTSEICKSVLLKPRTEAQSWSLTLEVNLHLNQLKLICKLGQYFYC